jgi:hypothetical protein
MAQAHPETAKELITAARAYIEHAYPGWHVRCSPRGMWIAERTHPPTTDAGGVHHIVRPRAADLAVALAQQAYAA